MEKGNKIKALLFLLFLVFIIVGGYIMMKKSTFKIPIDNKVVELNKEQADIRIDTDKEYIYFTDVDHIHHELDIEYKTININFPDQNGIAKLLNDETVELKQSLTYDETIEEAVYNHLVSSKYKIYNIYNYDNYISLVVDYYEYHYETLVSYLSTKVYVFDKIDGHIITEEEILQKYNLTKEAIIEKVKNHLNDENIGKEDILDVESTIEGLEPLNLYVDKIGRLSISILVKSEQNDYNEVIVLN